MRKIEALLQEYGESHQNTFNKKVHWICVPLIFFSIMGLIWSIPPGPLSAFEESMNGYANWATVVMVLVIFYYLSLSVPLALGMAAFGFICLYLCKLISLTTSIPLWQISIVIFVLAWIGQFYGHKIEGKKPSFFKDVQFLMIGPAWLMHFIFKKAGLKY